MTKYSFLIIALTSSFFSCQKPLIIDSEMYARKIVINSLFHPNADLKATITRSMDLDQTDVIEELSDASVMLFVDGVFAENMTYLKNPADKLGSFYASFPPEEDKSYSLEVSLGDEKATTPASSVPPNTPITDASSNWVAWGDSTNIIRYYFDFTISDPLMPSFYYFDLSFPIYIRNEETEELDLYETRYMEILSNDLPNHEIYFNNGILFNDEGFDGVNKRITGTATTINRFDPPEELEDREFLVDKSKLNITFHSVTDEGYKFHSSVAKKIAASSDIYSEPAVIYSNISNGLGIFAGENITKLAVMIVY